MDFVKEKAFYYKSEDKDDILKTVRSKDFVLVETSLSLFDICDENEKIVNFKIDDNLYFSSDKYCLINNKLYRFNFFIKKLNYVLICDNCIIKYNYIYKKELLKEIKILKNFKLNCKLIDYQITKNYIVLSINKIDAIILKKLLPITDINKKFDIMFQTLEQLVYLENNKILYNDLSTSNLLYNNKKVYLIDYGSFYVKTNLYSYRNVDISVTLIQYFLNFLLTLFSNRKKIYYNNTVNIYNAIYKHNDYTFEEMMIIKNFVVFIQKQRIDTYKKIMNYFKIKYPKYYLIYIITSIKNYDD